MKRSCFELEIGGAGVIPETTLPRDLADVLKTIEAVLLETAKAQGWKDTAGPIVSLVGIAKGSNRLTFSVADEARSTVVAISDAVRSCTYTRIPLSAHEALHELYKQAVNKGWTLTFHDHSSIPQPAVISKEHAVPPPESPHAKGTTTIYGRCVRVGGVKPKAEIRLAQGQLLNIDVSEQMAKELARSLYDEVCVEGEATWRTDTWAIEDFRATRVTAFRATDPADAFEQLAAAAKGRWDGVDVEEYVRNLRAAEDES